MIELFENIKSVVICAFAYLLVVLLYVLCPLPFILKEIIHEENN